MTVDHKEKDVRFKLVESWCKEPPVLMYNATYCTGFGIWGHGEMVITSDC